MEGQEAISCAVVQELQRELEKQADVIFQLRQDNVTLRSKLESERELCQSYADQMHQMEQEWHTPRQPLSNPSRLSAVSCTQMTLRDCLGTETGLNCRQAMVPTTDNTSFALTRNGIPLTIRTQLQPSNSERSWGDDAEVMSVSDTERDVCDETGERSECRMRQTPRQSCSLFFYKRKNKQSKGRASFAHIPRPIPPSLQSSESTGCASSQVSSHSDEGVNQTSASTQKAPRPVVRKNTEDACLDNLSRIGWTEPTSDLGQKLVLIKDAYSRNTDVFEDDVRFMREVLDGKSHAPEMDVQAELSHVMKDFKAWKKQFKESIRELEAALKTTGPRHGDVISTGNVENKKEGASAKSSSVISSIGKLLTRTLA